jgi:hypothetical protein
MRHLRSFAIVGALAILALGSGCDKDKAKPDETKKSEPTPVPSGMVFNDFLPAQGGNSAGLGVRDSGLEGGLAAVGGGSGPGEPDPGAGDPPGDPGAAPAEKLKVIEPGAEPRALRKYTFAANRVDKRVLTITQAVTQTMGGQSSPAQEITLKLYLDLTPKQVKPSGATIEAKVTKVELPGAPPQATAMLASMSGLSGTFEVSPRGEAGEVSFAANQQMKNQLAESVLQGLSQAVQLLLAPFPDAPIGVGAKWEISASKAEHADQGTKRFTLKEMTNDTGVVETEIDIKVPRRAAQAPRGGGVMFVEVDGKGKYTYQVKLDRMSPKVEGELTLVEKIEVPADPKGGGPGGGGKQQVQQTQKAKHLIETPK